MFAAVWAALNNVRLPRTRAIGFDTDLLNNNRQTVGNLDSFDIKGSLAKTRGATGLPTSKKTGGAGGPIANDDEGVDPSVKDRMGIDFEVMDVWDSGVHLTGSHDFPVAITVNMVSRLLERCRAAPLTAVSLLLLSCPAEICLMPH
jgi:hypothetical protein